jgi:peptidoglycan/LPS O-acetylase OafA/YrhL
MILSSQLTPAQRSYLDLLRCVAAGLVVFGHAGQHFLQGSFIASGRPQGFGVMLFFLISGFLISTSAFQKIGDPSYGFSEFAIDRFARIYACYIPALILLPAIDTLMLASPDYQWRSSFNLRTWVANFLMLQDFPVFQVLRRLGVPDQPWFVSSFGSARPFWTICIEWWIYMSFGTALFLVLRSRERRWFVLPMLVLFLIEPFYYFVGGVDDCLAILWLLGMAASLLFLRLPSLIAASPTWLSRRWPSVAVAVAGFGLLCMSGRVFAREYRSVNELEFGLFVFLFVFGLLFALAATQRPMPHLVEQIVSFIAAYSYSLYLTHFTVMELLAVWYPHHDDDRSLFWGSVALANLFAIGFYFLFERHYKWLARWLKAVLRAERTIPVTGRV